MPQSTQIMQPRTPGNIKQPKTNRCPAVSEVFKALSDDKALMIFNTIALGPGDSIRLSDNLNLSRKQYYSKMERLSKQGLVTRKNGKYYLTTLGKVLYELQLLLGIAIDNFWKLKAIDSLQNPDNLPELELARLIDTIIDSEELKNVILKKSHNVPVKSHS
jgi:predicted transcriptional regulator